MARLHSLTSEIVHSTFHHVHCQSFSKKDLVALYDVCKHLRNVVEPFLYREITWSWPDPSTFDISPMYPLLKSIFDQSEIASAVHHLTFRGWHGCGMLKIEDLDVSQRVALRELALNANVPDTPPQDLGQLAEQVDLHAPMLISQLPNI
jgi:hypothetical protein